MLRNVVLFALLQACATLTDPDYAAEAAAMRNMLEKVRAKNEDGVVQHKAPHAVKAAQSFDNNDESNPKLSNLDAELFARADAVEREMNKDVLKTNKLSAAAVHEQSDAPHARAARFFALHGMTQIGHLLGDDLSSTDKEQAVREEAQVQRMYESKTTLLNKHRLGSLSAAPPTDAVSAELDLDLVEDDEERKEKARWQAVDKLKHRIPHV
mmetsp:Transcript_88154/g.169735  ORF Transcript_88154/g.169735 Transcript_88154/m.169735 type:complete len:211 (+) Transcript_88154:86-718(+)|eukprot:CAMPEP_0172704904 /NCGR_PEP_ID=MMETSP1074-20121228/42006_1 /TAXON_ID=2916 /ORGANISM="Ceratium fusus, Strain PA161109" /LENGTH=210 /DNA_ID=CAMNT_0013527149 /DNA_START=85 /DNA_END=717 /DNA_ORIENTATION=-